VSTFFGGGNHQPTGAQGQRQAKPLGQKAGADVASRRRARAPTDRRYWLLALPLALVFALLWAVALLTYLLPPAEVYGNLFNGSLTRNQALFIGAARVLFLEFTFARHLFCRYACAVGMFQSLAWMSNRRRWWWAISASAPATAPVVRRSATTPARCGSNRATSSG
jgi:hypothetical protein